MKSWFIITVLGISTTSDDYPLKLMRRTGLDSSEQTIPNRCICNIPSFSASNQDYAQTTFKRKAELNHPLNTTATRKYRCWCFFSTAYGPIFVLKPLRLFQIDGYIDHSIASAKKSNRKTRDRNPKSLEITGGADQAYWSPSPARGSPKGDWAVLQRARREPWQKAAAFSRAFMMGHILLVDRTAVWGWLQYIVDWGWHIRSSPKILGIGIWRSVQGNLIKTDCCIDVPKCLTRTSDLSHACWPYYAISHWGRSQENPRIWVATSTFTELERGNYVKKGVFWCDRNILCNSIMPLEWRDSGIDVLDQEQICKCHVAFQSREIPQNTSVLRIRVSYWKEVLELAVSDHFCKSIKDSEFRYAVGVSISQCVFSSRSRFTQKHWLMRISIKGVTRFPTWARSLPNRDRWAGDRGTDFQLRCIATNFISLHPMRSCQRNESRVSKITSYKCFACGKQNL